MITCVKPWSVSLRRTQGEVSSPIRRTACSSSTASRAAGPSQGPVRRDDFDGIGELAVFSPLDFLAAVTGSEDGHALAREIAASRVARDQG